MSLLIDGYNLLNAVGIIPRGVGPGTLERSRLALLNFLAESLDDAEVPRTTVVFDAGPDAPRGLPRLIEHRGITVRYASQYEDADALIEELIRAESAPRRLTVVSSDHRVQRAARRRRARAVDSDAWYAEIVRGRRGRPKSTPGPAKPNVPLLEEEVAQWVQRFGGEAYLERVVEEAEADDAAPIDNPFPPGYAEDLLEEDRRGDPTDPSPPANGKEGER
jgi:predicted RNA-binding protein with PIN domain